MTDLRIAASEALARHPALRGSALERPEVGSLDGDLVVSGWVLGADGPVERVAVRAGERVIGHVRADRQRNDLADAFPDVAHAARSGFRLRLPHSIAQSLSELEVCADTAESGSIPVWRIRLGPEPAADKRPRSRLRGRRRREAASGRPVSEARLPAAFEGDLPRVVAIVSAFNEADVIGFTLEHLAEHGVASYLLDNGSTDDTVAAAEELLGSGLLGVESLPPLEDGTVAWRRILERKVELSRELGADWYIHHDADEFREPPWPGMTLREAIGLVDRMGFNAIDHRVLNFPPVDDAFRAGDDPREHFRRWEDAAEYDRMQRKAWKAGPWAVALEDGGHDVRFEGRRLFPLRFLLRHYPIRSQAHGARKVLKERKGRFVPDEIEIGWHRQYDDVAGPDHLFLRNPAELTPFDLERVRLATLLEPHDATLADPPAEAGGSVAPEDARGVLERVGEATISGWAAREGHGDVLEVTIWDGAEPIATLNADQPRADLQRVNLGEGLGGFALRTPNRLLDGRPHWIWATIGEAGPPLRGSPRVLHSVAGGSSAKGEARKAGSPA
jgi:hypothetical protein